MLVLKLGSESTLEELKTAELWRSEHLCVIPEARRVQWARSGDASAKLMKLTLAPTELLWLNGAELASSTELG